MSWLLKVLGAGLMVLVLAIAVGFLLPSQVHVERSIAINAPAETIFAEISDFHQWQDWSPWAKLDPDAAMAISGSGVGQTMTWSSDNPQVGQGSQTIVALESPTVLKTHLTFANQPAAIALFTLLPEGDFTKVVWSLDTDVRQGVPLVQQPISTYFGFLLDSLLGKDYETGLQNLKQVVEATSKA